MFHMFDHARPPRRLTRYRDPFRVVHVANGDSIWMLCERKPYTMPYIVQGAERTTAPMTCLAC